MIKGRFYSLDYASALFVKSVSIKIQFFLKKGIANFKSIVYTSRCCDMIAMKREVAADKAGFPWSECQVRKLTTSHCTSSKDHQGDGTRERPQRTRVEMCTVAACRTDNEYE